MDCSLALGVCSAIAWTGYINEADFASACRQLGCRMSAKELRRVMGEIDTDHDGRIQYKQVPQKYSNRGTPYNPVTPLR